jgi:two-component system, chemotaxis family, protein-glutamate methylesterase/glutaminase
VIDRQTETCAAPCAVAIGASAGGVQALRTIITALPADLPAAVFIVLHLDPHGHSLLPMLLAAVTPLRFRDVRDESLVERGTVYVAVPDRHLLVCNGRVQLAVSAPVHHVRPSVDRLFESIAVSWLSAAVGVILTGNGADGASGIAAIKRGGGCTIVQDPSDAEYPGMPQAAIATGAVDAVLPLAAIAPAVARAAAIAAAGRAA